MDLGAAPGVDTVTLFPGEGPRSIVDQLSREPESLARSLAVNLRSLHHPKLLLAFDCMLAIGPEHARVFAEAGWDKAQLKARLHELLQLPGSEFVREGWSVKHMHRLMMKSSRYVQSSRVTTHHE